MASTVTYSNFLGKLGKAIHYSAKGFRNKTNDTFISNKFQIRQATTYKAAVLKELNQPIVIEEMPQANLKKGQVRIAVKTCAVNTSDLLMCQGVSKVQPTLPFVPGFELAGEVIETTTPPPKPSPKKSKKRMSKDEDKSEDKKKGDDDAKEAAKGKEKEKDTGKNRKEPKKDDDEDDDDYPLQVGERVVALSRELLGGFSEQCIVDEKDVWRIPSNMDFKTAAAIADSYSLALLGLARRAKIRENDLVLVTAGAGGLGIAGIDIAANVYKAKVIGMCSTEDCGEILRSKGAWSAITFGEQTLKSKVTELSGKHGVDVVFETVGGPVFESAIHSVAHEGKVIVGGFASQQIPDLRMSELLTLPSFSLIGVSLRNYREANYKIYRQIVNDVISLYELGHINPIISKTYEISEVNDALTNIIDTKTIGKLILNVVKH